MSADELAHEYGRAWGDTPDAHELADRVIAEQESQAAVDPERDKIIRLERFRHEARSQIAVEEARRAMALPATPPSRSLEDRLREAPPPAPHHIEELARRNHNVVVGALYKTGKTSLAVDRVRAEADGLPFLGAFATERIEGNVGFWNNELEAADLDDYFRHVGIVNRAKVRIEDFKGFRIPLLHDVGAEWAIKWLAEREIESWYLDPWRVVCSWSGVSEYKDPEVAPLIDRIDAIKREAGVRYTHINHHCGAHDLTRPRGATSLPDWADSIWIYVRDQGRRYLSATGRGVSLDEGAVELTDSGRLVFREGGRREQTLAIARDELVAYVEAHPGCNTGEATAAIENQGKDLRQRALESAKERGLIFEGKRGTAKPLYPAGHEDIQGALDV